MNPNICPLEPAQAPPETEHWAGGRAFEVTDFTLFMYGLVRGDIVVASLEGKPHYQDLGVYELDGAWRLGLPFFETNRVWTMLSGLVTASKVEFTVAPGDKERLTWHGHIVAVVRSALRGVGW
jgi:hypothetical protein